MRDVKLADFINSVNKSLKDNVINMGPNFKSLKLSRFSSGSFNLDMALGGGWPFSRLAMIAGEYSTGKSLIAMKAAALVTEYDHTTKKHKDLVDPKFFTPGRVLFVDAEGSLDEDWAKALGFDVDNHVIARPEYAEQVVDIVSAAIEENLFDLIVVDSIAAMTPLKELEESAEDQQMGLAARINNKAMRRWNSKLVAMSQNGPGGPLLLCLNQFRLQIGTYFGDPRVMPGGKGQNFCSSIIVYTRSAAYEKDKKADKDGPAKALAYAEFAGNVHKNKTFVPRQNYKFKFFLRDAGEIKKGTIENVDDMMAAGKNLGLIKKGSGVNFGKYEYSSLSEMRDKVAISPVIQKLLWRSCLKAHCGVHW